MIFYKIYLIVWTLSQIHCHNNETRSAGKINRVSSSILFQSRFSNRSWCTTSNAAVPTWRPWTCTPGWTGGPSTRSLTPSGRWGLWGWLFTSFCQRISSVLFFTNRPPIWSRLCPSSPFSRFTTKSSCRTLESSSFFSDPKAWKWFRGTTKITWSNLPQLSSSGKRCPRSSFSKSQSLTNSSKSSKSFEKPLYELATCFCLFLIWTK